MAAVEHPAWCDPEHCTTPAEQPTQPETGALWEHRGAPSPLPLAWTQLHLQALGRVLNTAPVTAAVFGPDQLAPFSAWLAQPLRTPWGGRRTFLRIGVGVTTLLSLDLSTDGDLATIELLASLVATAQADTHARIERDLRR
jgi:hypothetical protein